MLSVISALHHVPHFMAGFSNSTCSVDHMRAYKVTCAL